MVWADGVTGNLEYFMLVSLGDWVGVEGLVFEAETRRARRKTRRAHFGDWLRFLELERRAGRSKPESAEAAEIIGLRGEAHAGLEG